MKYTNNKTVAIEKKFARILFRFFLIGKKNTKKDKTKKMIPEIAIYEKFIRFIVFNLNYFSCFCLLPLIDLPPNQNK